MIWLPWPLIYTKLTNDLSLAKHSLRLFLTFTGAVANREKEINFQIKQVNNHLHSFVVSNSFLEESSNQLCQDTLEELDWCLGQLESMDYSSSMSNMAENKFKQMLNKELLDFSESSRAGNQIADFITSTYYGKNFDVQSWQLLTFLFSDKQFDLCDGEPGVHEQPVRYSGIRKGSIMTHVTAIKDISTISLYKEDRIPTLGVNTSQPALLAKVSNS